MMILSAMDVDGCHGYIDDLFSNESDKWLDATTKIKYIVIGNNKQKSCIINYGVIPRLLQWMIDDVTPIELRTEAAVVLGSLAKGVEENIDCLVEAGTVSVLLKGLSNNNLKYVEACLRCLRIIFSSSLTAVDFIYQDATVIPHLINIISKSVCTQECITTIFADCCKTETHQSLLCSNGAIAALAPLLCSNIYKVQMPTLSCFAMMCYQNEQVSMAVATATYNAEPIPNLFVKLLARDKTHEMQMAAAQCLTYLCRGGAISPDNPIIVLKTLPTLVRMCKRERSIEERVEGAEALAYLIEVNSDLQKTAAITDHCIRTLAEYLKFTEVHQFIVKNHQRKDVSSMDELKQAAFKAFAALAANDEDIRKRILEMDGLMEQVVDGMNSNSVKVQVASVRCLHSLSRSVQQLRTTFHDYNVWKPLMKIIQNGPHEALAVTSSVLCNLLLEFSPSKEPILEEGAVEILVRLTSHEDPSLRLNGIWGLMNMAFQAEQKLKTHIITSVGPDRLLKLLSDPIPSILIKTLGLLRNLLSGKPHIDLLMNMYGKQMIQAVILILEGDHSLDIKEQTLCILTNIADGNSAKDYIMTNEDVLKKLMSYMMCTSVNLQLTATLCITNLIWNDEEGAHSRQAKLRDMGVQKILHQLQTQTHQDLILNEKVKAALEQFGG
ncbi:armadillo repeat-containing protein 8-like [Liolophura sinensis]|uniref:armadillo repeat-containing protein 8-like n=1 Tax=Liolophura sinensis TaxID=3198878 RepID=UPI0031587D34